MEAHATNADARCSAGSRSIDAAARSENTQACQRTDAKSWPEGVFSPAGSAETGEHTADHCNSDGGTSSRYATPQTSIDGAADTSAISEYDIVAVATKLQRGGEILGSIYYQEQEVRQDDPLIMELFRVISHLSKELTHIAPEHLIEGIPRLKVVSSKGPEALASAGIINTESFTDTETLRGNEGKETAETEEGLGSPFDTASPAGTAQTGSTVDNPSLLPPVEADIDDFAGFWNSSRGSHIARIADDKNHDFTGMGVKDAGDYLYAISMLRELVDPEILDCHNGLEMGMPRKIMVWIWDITDGNMGEEEANTGVEESCTDLSQDQHNQVTEGVLIEGDTASDPLRQGQRRGTPFPGHENGDSDKENRSDPIRSRKRRWKALGSNEDDERKKRHNGASREYPIDLTGD
ncbi:hypothetical protein MPH_09258 [Macrophomina phaseolina MS6]|uniref:Uncharacterized protein n=1 Tax=Macrophomina phaseolina (strain MS6) TaxID=1126212 RepID=K2QVB2_MACPH|nr:hypothetical protein MPH_09258 [Macrophomina phaseolina MS6]